MPLYEIQGIQDEKGGFAVSKLDKVSETTFAKENLLERRDIQRLLRGAIEAIAPETYVVAEELSTWEENKLRIDLLCIDKNANLVVVELKRDDDGGLMELQALRYAAMISPLTFPQLVKIHTAFLGGETTTDDAQQAIFTFLGWDVPDENAFNKKMRIVLASANFCTEVTTTVLWLTNTYGLDIRCVRMKPHKLDGRLLVDVQQIIPLLEAADYQVRIREKVQEERAAKQGSGDGRFTITLGNKILANLSQRGAVFAAVMYLRENGVDPERIRQALAEVYSPHLLWAVAEGSFDTPEAFRAAVQTPQKYTWYQYFDADNERFVFDGKSYALRNRWGGGAAPVALNTLQSTFSDGSNFVISFVQSSTP